MHLERVRALEVVRKQDGSGHDDELHKDEAWDDGVAAMSVVAYRHLSPDVLGAVRAENTVPC